VTHAQLLVLGAWVVAGVALVGIGQLARRLLCGPDRERDLLGSFWIGWATLVLVLQLWHVVLPVDARASAAMAAVGIAGLVAAGAAPWARLLRGMPRDAPAWIACAALAVWLSNHALGGARYGDTGAYYVPTVKWLREYALVPGLGNLHPHLAFNQSYFGYVAALEVGPFVGRSFSIANGLLILAVLMQAAVAAWRLVGGRGRARAVDLFFLLMLPGLLPLALSIFVTSPAPDVATFALGAVATAELVALATSEPARSGQHLRQLALLVLAGLTSKLTFAGLGAGLLLVAVALWLRRARPSPATVGWELGVVSLLAILAMGTWMARSIVMTGSPLFPSMAIALPFDWRVRYDIETWFRTAVYAGGPSIVYRDPRWFLAQLVRLGWGAPVVLGPIVAGAVGVAIGGARRLGRAFAPARDSALPLAIVLPPLASLVFSAVNNPVPRYAGATFWLFAACAILFAIGDVVLSARLPVRAVATAVCLTIAAFAARTEIDPLWLPLTDFEQNQQVRFEARRLETGLTLYVPVGVEACWNAPLPCTPFPNPALRLRRDGDLASGFTIDPVVDERYHYDPGAPWVHPGGR